MLSVGLAGQFVSRPPLVHYCFVVIKVALLSVHSCMLINPDGVDHRGRGMETLGEDPLVAGEYGARFVAAAQAQSGNGSRQLRRVVLAPKHFLDYDLEGRKWWPGDKLWPMRREFNAVVSKQDQMEYFLPAWHATVKIGQPGGVMCATSAVNGVDSCMNPTYLHGFLREACSFSGFVVTDGNSCGAVYCIEHLQSFSLTS